MIKAMIQGLKAVFFIGILGYVSMASADEVVIIKKETPEYILDIKYPQKGYKFPEFNSSVKALIAKTRKSFFDELIEDVSTPADAPGKTGLTITYSQPYKTKTVMSYQFNVSSYHRGAAHPVSQVLTLNFINGHLVQLADLFNKDAAYLKLISVYCYKAVAEKKISDDKWIKEGTEPLSKNYPTWYFSAKGLHIVFGTYQVAAYVYGEQDVEVPLAVFSKLVKPDVSKTVWGK